MDFGESEGVPRKNNFAVESWILKKSEGTQIFHFFNLNLNQTCKENEPSLCPRTFQSEIIFDLEIVLL